MPDQRDPPAAEHRTESAGPAARALYPHPVIAREGWPFIALSVLLALFAWWLAGFWWSLPVWIVAVFMLQFFRDPPRAPPLAPNLVISPADGRIVSVERAQDPYLRRDAIKLSVFMNVFNVHSNRSPVDGNVSELWYSYGSFFNAALDKASAGNERNALWIRADPGVDVTCVQIAGYVARRILCYVRKGDRLRRGQRFGFIRFGSRVDVFVPADARARVSVGDKVYGGATIIAELSATAQRPQ